MTKKRLLFFFIVGILLLITGGILYYFYQLNKQSTLSEYIPKNAEVVVFLNTQNLIKKQLFKSKDTSLLNKIRNKLEEIPYLKGIKSADELGIDVFSGIAFIESNNIQYSLIKLKAIDKIESYFKKKKLLFSELKSEKNSHLYLSNDKLFYVGYNSDIVAIMKYDKTKDVLAYYNLLNVKFDASFAQTNNFKISKNDSAYAWFYDNKKIISPKRAYRGYIQVNNGLNLYASEVSANMLSFPVKTDTTFINKNLIYVGEEKSLNPVIYEKIHQFADFFELSTYDDSYANFNFSDGKYLINFRGTKVVDKKSIGYEFDDNFNKSMVIKTTKDTIEACNLFYKNSLREGIYTNYPNEFINAIQWPDSTYETFITLDEQAFQYIVPMPIKFKLSAWSKTTSDGSFCYFSLKINSIKELNF